MQRRVDFFFWVMCSIETSGLRKHPTSFDDGSFRRCRRQNLASKKCLRFWRTQVRRTRPRQSKGTKNRNISYRNVDIFLITASLSELRSRCFEMVNCMLLSYPFVQNCAASKRCVSRELLFSMVFREGGFVVNF